MLVTVFSDASWCPHVKVGGWGAWVKSERLQHQSGGELKSKPISAREAEVMAIGNAVWLALRMGAARPGDEILIQTDCLHAIDVLNEGKCKRRTSAEVDVCLALVSWRAKYQLTMRFKHVKGHTAGHEPRLWVNNFCDRLAKHYMRQARTALKSKGVKNG